MFWSNWRNQTHTPCFDLFGNSGLFLVILASSGRSSLLKLIPSQSGSFQFCTTDDLHLQHFSGAKEIRMETIRRFSPLGRGVLNVNLYGVVPAKDILSRGSRIFPFK